MSKFSWKGSEIPDDLRRYSRYEGRGRDVVGDDCRGGDDRVSSDRHARQDGGSGSIHTFPSIVIGSAVM